MSTISGAGGRGGAPLHPFSCTRTAGGGVGALSSFHSPISPPGHAFQCRPLLPGQHWTGRGMGVTASTPGHALQPPHRRVGAEGVSRSPGAWVPACWPPPSQPPARAAGGQRSPALCGGGLSAPCLALDRDGSVR